MAACDLIVRRGRVPGHEGVADVGVRRGRIVQIAPTIRGRAPVEIPADGRLVAPTFVEPHIHLDKVLVSERVRANLSGTLAEAIEIMWEAKRRYTVEDVARRAGRVIELAVTHGVTEIRTHVDVDPIGGLTPLRGVAEARRRYRDLCRIQIVAFPQEGIVKSPGTDRLLARAMRAGAEVVGGMPHNEDTPADSVRHIDTAFALARRYRADIDMHVDETDDPQSRTLAELAARTLRHHYGGRVTAGHICALAAYDDPYAAKVINLMARAGVNVVTNPATNLMLQGRFDRQPIRRGVPRVKELLAAGVVTAFGQDCVKDTFYPSWGQADPLEVGQITAHALQFTQPGEVETLAEMCTVSAARILGLRDYGVRVGAVASLNVIEAPTFAEAFRTRAARRYVLFRGRVVAETVTTSTLHRAR
ncbi:MAG TPA: amidohydrolase family protein [bacterium]|nr:amidohydrolase family protein [bacterium]